MVLSAWVAVGVFVLQAGNTVIDTAGPFATLAEREATNAELAPGLKTKGDLLLAFGLTCTEVKVDDDNVTKKAKPAPSKAPIEQRETGVGVDGRTYL